MNRLLINMVNKVQTIKVAIDQVEQLKKGETIVLNGLQTLSFTRVGLTDQQLDDLKFELISKMYNLQERIWRMGGEY